MEIVIPAFLSAQKHIGIDVLSLFGDLKSIQMSYDIDRDSQNAFSAGVIINLKSRTEVIPNDMDGRRINYNLRNGINGGITFGYRRHIVKDLYFQNIIKFEYNRLNLSTYTASKSDSIGDVIYYTDFGNREIDRNVFTFTNSLGFVVELDASFFKLKIGPNININTSSFNSYFPNNNIVSNLNKDSSYHSKLLSRYILSYENKFRIFPSIFLSMHFKIAD